MVHPIFCPSELNFAPDVSPPVSFSSVGPCHSAYPPVPTRNSIHPSAATSDGPRKMTQSTMGYTVDDILLPYLLGSCSELDFSIILGVLLLFPFISTLLRLFFGLMEQTDVGNGAQNSKVLPACADEHGGVIVDMEQTNVGNGAQNSEVLPACADEHGGVIVDMKEPMDPNVFQTMLRASLSQWKLEGKKGVWIKLPIELVYLVETAVKEGFFYHHAEPNYLMLVLWIPKTMSALPANATHRVRIAAIVMNDKRELLVVQEKVGVYWGKGIWKIPTGVLEEGEDIFTGAPREVKEETGVDTEFVDVIAFRQMHNCFFGKSELCFVCTLHPSSFEIHKQESEIEEAQWMPFEEYADQPDVQNHCIFKHVKDICLARIERDYTGLTPIPITPLFSDKISHLYINHQGLKQ